MSNIDNLNKLISYLGIPEKDIYIHKFTGNSKDAFGYASDSIHLNEDYVKEYGMMLTLIHEYIHYYFWDSQDKDYDGGMLYQRRHKTKKQKASIVEKIMSIERYTDTLAFLILHEFLEQNNIVDVEVKSREIVGGKQLFKTLYRYYFNETYRED
jgi:hypothetical protein